MKKMLPLLLVLALCLSLAACAAGPVEKTGVYVTNPIEGIPETEYVLAVSRHDPEAAFLVEELNKVIDETDLDALFTKYMDYATRRRSDPIGEINLLDNDGAYIYAYGSVLEPFNFSGAGGAYADGVDVWLLSQMAEKHGRRLQLNDCWFNDAYEAARDGKGVCLSGVALTDQVKQDFLVTRVYTTGHQQIISDETENFTKLEQLKGMTVGVLGGRTGEALVSQAIENGVLKGTGATVVVYYTDAEAFLALKNEDCDVLVMDELAAQMVVARGW